MLVLVGLGNPGAKYAHHRHNVGFLAVDAIAEHFGFDAPKKKFNGDLHEGFLTGPSGRTKALILKPGTYMNESGRAVGALAKFYKLAPEDFVVFHDELDLAPGKLRVKTGGGNAGHNGLRSIDAHLGNDFRRVRIGIGHPGAKHLVSNYVLGDFAKSDQEWLAPMIDAIAKAAPALADEDARFASDVAQTLSGPQELRKKPNSKPKKSEATAKEPPCDTPPKVTTTSKTSMAEALQKLLGLNKR